MLRKWREGRARVVDAEHQLKRVREQRPEAEEIAAEIREFVDENNFAARVWGLHPHGRKL